MRRELLLWLVGLGAVLLAFGVTVLALNLTVYSATGFVSTYLEALQRKDAPAAIELAGAVGDGDGDASEALLVRDAMGDLDEFAIIADRTDELGVHLVTASFTTAGETGSTEFAVERTGSFLGLFNDWSFAIAPYSVLQLTVQHEDDFTANGLDQTAIAGQDVVSSYLAFTPTLIDLTHRSQYLEAEPVAVLLDRPGEPVEAALDIQANAAFAAEVQRQVDAFLDDCTTQAVLLPAGCPFGQVIDNRVVSDPVWSMVEYPPLTVEPSGAVATWAVPRTTGAAHLVVDVQSLFDGTITTFDEDVAFDVEYTVQILPDDLLIQPAG